MPPPAEMAAILSIGLTEVKITIYGISFTQHFSHFLYLTLAHSNLRVRHGWFDWQLVNDWLKIVFFYLYHFDVQLFNELKK